MTPGSDVIGTNLTSCFSWIKHLARPMTRKRWGRIINISSVSRTDWKRRTGQLRGSEGWHAWPHQEPRQGICGAQCHGQRRRSWIHRNRI